MPDGSMQKGVRHVVPTTETARVFRDCLGRFASGVTVVTAPTGQGGIGMTANSFTSVSMDPPLVLWCPAKASSRFPVFSAATTFAIHVLRADQEPVARAFAKSAQPFDVCAFDRSAAGVPVLDDCLARFECQTHAIHDAGDHAIMIGRVLAAHMSDGAPLVFSQGRFIPFDNEGEKANQ